MVEIGLPSFRLFGVTRNHGYLALSLFARLGESKIGP